MTRLVHIGDLHLKPGPRNADRLGALDFIINSTIHTSSESPRIGAWLFPGDLNDSRMSISDRNALAERLTRMANVAPVVMVPGNHDLDGELSVFSRLKAKYPIFVVDEPQTLPFTLATGEDAVCFCLPYPSRAGLAGMGISHHDQLAAASEALDYIFMRAGAELEEARQHGLLTLAIGHVNVAGAITSTGQPQIGKELEITAEHLARLGDCYKGLNHVHEFQSIAGAWYPGSVSPANYGEITPRRFLLIDCDGDSYQVSARIIPTKAMYHVTGELTHAGFTYAVTAGPGGEAQPKPLTWAGTEVRARVSFAKGDTSTLSRALVYAEFADAASVQYEFIAKLDGAVRAPEVAAARTFEDKARAWAAVNGLSLTDSLIEKLQAIATGDAAQFLAALETRLSETERRETAVAA